MSGFQTSPAPPLDKGRTKVKIEATTLDKKRGILIFCASVELAFTAEGFDSGEFKSGGMNEKQAVAVGNLGIIAL